MQPTDNLIYTLILFVYNVACEINVTRTHKLCVRVCMHACVHATVCVCACVYTELEILLVHQPMTTGLPPDK